MNIDMHVSFIIVINYLPTLRIVYVPHPTIHLSSHFLLVVVVSVV